MAGPCANRSLPPPLAVTSSSRSMLSVNALVLVGIAVGLLNNMAIAALFGLTRRLDAYYAAMLLPTFFIVLCVDSLGKNFLPLFARARKIGFDMASDLASSVVTLVALLSAAVALVLALASKPLFTALLPGFDAAEIDLVCRYFWIMAPALVLSTITLFHEYVWQHDEEYTRVMAVRTSQSFVNFAAIVGIGPLLGEYALPIAFLAAHAVMFVLMARRVRYRYRPRLAMRAEWEKKIFMNSAILLGSGLTMRIRPVVGQYVGSLLGEGAIAALSLGYRLVEPLERSAFSGVRMLMFSRTSRLAAEANSREVARLYRLGLGGAFLLLAPLIWWLSLESETLVAFLFERGAFDAAMTPLVALALVGYAPSVLFVGVNSLLCNAFYALDRVKVPAAVLTVGTLVYVAAVLAAYGPFGVLGVAAASTAAAVASSLLLLWFLPDAVPGLHRGRLLAALAGYAALGGIALWLPAMLVERAGWSGIFAAGAVLVVGMALYLGVLAVARDRTLADVVTYFRRAHPLLARSPREAA